MNISLFSLLKEKSIIFILICLTPFLLVTGPFLSDLAVVIIAIACILNFLRIKFFPYHEKFVKVFIIFFLLIFISSILSDNISFSLKKTIPYLRFLFLSLSIMYMMKNDNNFLKFFSNFLIITYSAVLIDGYIQLIFGVNILGMELHHFSRLSSFFGDELILGSYLVRFLPLFVFSLIYLKFDKKKIIILILISDFLIFHSGERTAFIFSLIVTSFLFIQIQRFRLISLIYFIVFACFVFITTKNTVISSRIDQTLVEIGISNKFKPGYTLDEVNKKNIQKKIFKSINFYSPMHENYFLTSINMFKDKHLFCHVPNSYRLKCSLSKYKLDHHSCSTHPHNTYAQLLSETGIFVFVLFLLIFLYFIFISFRHLIYSFGTLKKHKFILNELELCLISSFLVTLLPFAPSGNFFNNWLSIIYFIPVGFYIGLKYIKCSNE